MQLDFNGNFKGKNHILSENTISYTATPSSGSVYVTPASPVSFFIRAIANHFGMYKILTKAKCHVQGPIQLGYSLYII